MFEGACIKGPCYIGENSVVGGNSLVRDFSSLGSNCVVGFSTEIKHSLIGDNCWFHMNYIGDSIISNNCLFGAGTITANFRFDENNVKVRIGEQTDRFGHKQAGRHNRRQLQNRNQHLSRTRSKDWPPEHGWSKR